MFNWREWDSHKQRWGTAVLMATPVVAVLIAGPYWLWWALVCLLAGLGLWEYQNMVFHKGLPPWWQAFYVSSGLLVPCGAFWLGPAGLHASVYLVLFVAFMGTLLITPQDADAISRLGKFVLGWLYIPYLLSYVLLIGRMDMAARWIFLALIVTIANDAGAYYCGKFYGRRKLYEVVSPKKTIEGSVGGIAGGMMAGTCFGLLFLPAASIAQVLLLSLGLTLVGQVGDLIESMLKRISGVKDSSQLLPGHGGLLDRLDSLLFVFPVVWFFANWIVIS